jgi:hypothetical protein
MALNRRVLEGRAGDPALPWWKEVWRWASSLPVVVGPGMEITQIPGMGTEIKFKTAAPVRIFFEVVLSGSRISVRPGMLEGQVPRILTPDAWVDLLGIRYGGIKTEIPTIDLSNEKPGPDGRSCIALVVELDFNFKIRPLENWPDSIRIEHREEFGPKQKREAEAVREPFHELAILYWREGKPERVLQVVQHNLALASGPTADEDAPRFFFYAAG